MVEILPVCENCGKESLGVQKKGFDRDKFCDCNNDYITLKVECEVYCWNCDEKHIEIADNFGEFRDAYDKGDHCGCGPDERNIKISKHTEH